MNLDPTIGVFMDGLIAVLLLATIATGLFLNRRIERLRKSTADMGTMVGGFDKATARARRHRGLAQRPARLGRAAARPDQRRPRPA